MITMRIKGGLGNQLFQYAAAYAMARRLHQPLQFDIAYTNNMTARSFKLPQLRCDETAVADGSRLPLGVRLVRSKHINKLCRVLNLPLHRCGRYLYCLETRDQWWPEVLTIEHDMLYVDGYFQSAAYFDACRAELLRQLVPAYEPAPEYRQLLSQIQQTQAVAVHVRRSDFVKDRHVFHYLLDEAYYQRAVAHMRSRVEKPVFFVFSDDLAWAKAHLGEQADFRYVNLSTEHADIDEMMLMKHCSHIITANSTFSWWAAWLNEHDDAIRIVPARPYGMEGMIPEQWIKL